MVLFLLVGAAAFAGERAYSRHKKSKKAKKLASSQQSLQPQPTEPILTTSRSAEVVQEEDLYEDLPPYQKDQGQVHLGGEVEVQPPVYERTVSSDTIPIPERSPLREKVAM